MKRLSSLFILSGFLLAPAALGPGQAFAQDASKDASKEPAKPPKDLSTMSAKELADLVQKVYDKTRTFQAGFQQRYTIKAYDKVKESKGRVAFDKPGKMSWRYDNGNRVVSDGKVLKVYEKDASQMYEQAVNKSQYPAALAFLIGEGNLRKEFRLRKISGERLNFPGGYVLVAKPRSPTPAFQRMLLYVDAGTHQVRRVLLLDAQGNKNRFTFVKPAVNQKVSASEFKFTPPQGTRVVKP